MVAVAVSEQPEVKLFNQWKFDDVQVSDLSLGDYIGVSVLKHATYVPHTAGRYSVKRFRKAQCPIVERLTNSLMMHGHNNGKKLMDVRIVKHAMEIIHLLTDANPIQVIVDAVINSGPRDDATRIGSAGVVRRQAVDISPLRRVNQALYLLTTASQESAFRNIKTIGKCARGPSAYVRKCAADALPKLHDLHQEENAYALEEIVGVLLSDHSPGVVGSAAAAFISNCPNNLSMIGRKFKRICETLPDVEEWGQILLIGILLRYVVVVYGLVKESIMFSRQGSDTGEDVGDSVVESENDNSR